MEFECEFEIEAGLSVPILFKIETEIVPCSVKLSQSGTETPISRVDITVYGENDTSILDAATQKNSTFMREYVADTEAVLIQKNITVVQRPDGIVFGVSGP